MIESVWSSRFIGYREDVMDFGIPIPEAIRYIWLRDIFYLDEMAQKAIEMYMSRGSRGPVFLGDVIGLPEEVLLKIPYFGERGLQQLRDGIMQILASYGNRD